MTDSDQVWIYAVDGTRNGPVSAREVATLVSGDRLSPGTLVWKPGMATWLPADEVPEIAGYFAPPPPIIPTQVHQDVGTARTGAGARPGLAAPTLRPQPAKISPRGTKVTELRLIGGAILIFNIWLIGSYNLEGIPVLLLTFGFAAVYELLIVSPASKKAGRD